MIPIYIPGCQIVIHDFYVSEITNYPEDEITEYKKEEFCGEKSVTSKEYIKEVSPNKFYIKYSNSSVGISFKH